MAKIVIKSHAFLPDRFHTFAQKVANWHQNKPILVGLPCARHNYNALFVKTSTISNILTYYARLYIAIH